MPQAVDEVLPSEAARIIGCSPQRVRQLVDDGRLPARRGPRGIRLIERRAAERLARDRQKRTRVHGGE